MATFIVSTARGSVHSLAWQGFTPAECHGQLTALLASATNGRALNEAARCLAQPIFDPQRETIDWYTDEPGPVRAFASLSPPEQDTLRGRVGEIGQMLLAHAKQLQAEAGSPQRELGGHLLELALRYPDDSCLYLAGEQPVITCWGFGPSTAGAQPQDISRLTGTPPAGSAAAAPIIPPGIPDTQAEPTVAVGPAPEAVVRRGWLWLLPLLLLLLLAGFLITSWCGRPPLLPVPGLTLQGPNLFCPADTGVLAQERQRELELIALLDSLRVKANLCTKAPEFRATAANPAPVIPPEPQKEALVIPEEASRDGDLSFLAGVWECSTGLSETATQSPITLLYTFDGKGTGYVAINSPTKGLCKGEATATMDADGLLTIQTGQSIACPTGNPFSGQAVQCRDSNGQALCTGRNLSTSGREWNAVFFKR